MVYFVPADTVNEHLVYGDVAQLNRVLVNLLSNAVRHTEANGSVVVQTHVQTNQQMTVTISDSGCGFEHNLKHQPLSTMSSTSFTSDGVGYSGTGLGLGIVARILELHGSEATVCSAPGVISNIILGYLSHITTCRIELEWMNKPVNSFDNSLRGEHHSWKTGGWSVERVKEES